MLIAIALLVIVSISGAENVEKTLDAPSDLGSAIASIEEEITDSTESSECSCDKASVDKSKKTPGVDRKPVSHLLPKDDLEPTSKSGKDEEVAKPDEENDTPVTIPSKEEDVKESSKVSTKPKSSKNQTENDKKSSKKRSKRDTKDKSSKRKSSGKTRDGKSKSKSGKDRK